MKYIASNILKIFCVLTMIIVSATFIFVMVVAYAWWSLLVIPAYMAGAVVLLFIMNFADYEITRYFNRKHKGDK